MKLQITNFAKFWKQN